MNGGFFDKYLDPEQFFDDVKLDDLERVYDIAKENALEGNKTLIIFDDVQKYFKQSDNEKLLLHIINNRRHAEVPMHR